MSLDFKFNSNGRFSKGAGPRDPSEEVENSQMFSTNAFIMEAGACWFLCRGIWRKVSGLKT